MEKKKKLKGKKDKESIGEEKAFDKTIIKKQLMDIFSGKGSFIKGLKNQRGDDFDVYVRLKEEKLEVYLFLP